MSVPSFDISGRMETCLDNSDTDYAGSLGNAFDLHMSDGQFESLPKMRVFMPFLSYPRDMQE